MTFPANPAAPIQALLWDIGGVLVRTMDRAPRTRLAERHGMSYAEMEKFVFGGEQGRLAQAGKIDAAQHIQAVCRQLGLPASQAAAFLDEFFAGDRLDQALVAFIRRCHASYKTGIISNAFNDVRATIQSKWQIADAFDSIVVSGEVGLLKPDRRIFELAVSELGVQPGQAVFIDDVAENVQGARAAGLYGIQFMNSEQVIADLTQILNGRAWPSTQPARR